MKKRQSVPIIITIWVLVCIACKGRNIFTNQPPISSPTDKYRLFVVIMPPFPNGDKVKFTVYIPSDWIIEGSMAGPIDPESGGCSKRVEFEKHKYATNPRNLSRFTSMLAGIGEKIVKETKRPDGYRVVVAENKNVVGESGDSVATYAVTSVSVVTKEDFYQSVAFYLIPELPAEHPEIRRMIDTIKIEIVRN